MSRDSKYVEIIKTVFDDAVLACYPETNKIPFTWKHLHKVADEVGGVGNVPDCLSTFRHKRRLMPEMIMDIAPSGYSVSILNQKQKHSKKPEPYFQVHPAFDMTITKTSPEIVLNDSRHFVMDEQYAIEIVERSRLLERFFRGAYREFGHIHEHVKSGQWGEIDGTCHAIRNSDDQTVVICLNAKMTTEEPSGLFSYHNAEIIANQKYPGLPVVHVFVYASEQHNLVDLYHIELNKHELTCKTMGSQSYHIIHRDR